jgi:heptosyltransferase I
VTDSLQRVLLVKTSSMGDLVHTLSAIQEAVQTRGNIQIDWVCEEAFADVAKLAPAIDRILPVAIRRWRTSLGSAATRAEIKRFKQTLQARDYDLVIDAQGLLKTAWITRLARCKNANRWGYDWASAREPLASLVVRHKVNAPAQWHAIQRLRVLFGAALGYTPKGAVSSLQIATAPLGPRNDEPDPSLRGAESPVAIHREIMLLHGTSRSEKSWPIDSWAELGRALAAQGYTLLLPWGSTQEQEQATQIAQQIGQAHAQVLPKRSIGELANTLQHCAGAIGVDSGLMHLSVALGRPTVAVMSASHLPKYSADRFAPFWAPHARVVQRESQADSITPAAVLRAWSALC